MMLCPPVCAWLARSSGDAKPQTWGQGDASASARRNRRTAAHSAGLPTYSVLAVSRYMPFNELEITPANGRDVTAGWLQTRRYAGMWRDESLGSVS